MIKNEQTIRTEIRRKGKFNIIDSESSFKIDFIFRSNTPYEILKFDRRQKIEVDKHHVWVITLDDLVISKLKWIQQSESELQKNDISQLIDKPTCDKDYIRNWCKKLRLNTFGLLK